MLFLFRIRLNKLFHIIDVYIYTPQDKIITEFIKNDPFQKCTYPWILILCVISWVIHDCFYILWCLFMSPLLFPEQFNRKILQLLHLLWFSSIFCIFDPFPKVTVWFWDPYFSHRGQLRDSYKTITKSENIYWCSRRQHSALRARGCKLLNRMMMMCKFFSFLFNYHIFSFSTGLQKTK